MSPRTRITTLNLGSQSIELAEFRTHAPGALTLYGYRSCELLPDLADSASKRGQVIIALREMLIDLKISGGPVNYTVAEDLTFTRFVSLPLIEQEKIDRIIAFEAQQNVPFPIDQVVWDYQLVGGGSGEQSQMMLVAIKADLLEDINAVVEETGLRTSVVDLATTALYNAYRHNYPERDGCALLIDIGARTTNLLFIQGTKLFTRSVPIGGGSITSAIAKEFNESFGEAEVRKKRDGFANLPNNGATNGDAARVANIVRAILTRLHAELARSISHYCTQQKGSAPDQVLLSGGGAGTSGVQEFFAEKLQLPIRLFDPLRNLEVAELATESIAGSKHLLGEPVGLALRAVVDCPVTLNLRPASVARRDTMKKRQPFLIGAALCFLLSILSWSAYYFFAVAHVLRQNTDSIQERIVRLRPIESQINELRRRTAKLDTIATPLLAAINDRSFWPETLEELNCRLPEQDIWITEVVATCKGIPLNGSDPSPHGGAANPASAPPVGLSQAEAAIDGVFLRGLYLFNSRQQEVVFDYFRNLVNSPWFAIDEKNQAKLIKSTTPNETEWAFPYELRLDLRKAAKLP